MEMENSKKMTDEERLALAAKLDKELDEFIDGLEKKRYSEGWPEDRWQEEMDKHPFFMKKAPEPGEELHPLLEGLQALKYDPEENTVEDLAEKNKEDGNFYMKNKSYRMALLCYTEGIKQKCTNRDLNAILYNNRSAAHFFLKNFRSSLYDAEKALELKSDYVKPRWRAAQSAFRINKFDVCMKHCDDIIEKEPNNTEATDLYQKCQQKKAELERDKRKKAVADKKKQRDLNRTIEELRKRKVKFDTFDLSEDITEEMLKPSLLPLEDSSVKANEQGILYWPAAFNYPEFLVSDFQQRLSEDITLEKCIAAMFEEPPDFDKQQKYRPHNVAVYYENRKKGTVHKVNLKKTLRDIIQEENFWITSGCVLFYVVLSGSKAEQDYLNEVRKASK